jgi:hypothetical protein
VAIACPSSWWGASFISLISYKIFEVKMAYLQIVLAEDRDCIVISGFPLVTSRQVVYKHILGKASLPVFINSAISQNFIDSVPSNQIEESFLILKQADFDWEGGTLTDYSLSQTVDLSVQTPMVQSGFLPCLNLSNPSNLPDSYLIVVISEAIHLDVTEQKGVDILSTVSHKYNLNLGFERHVIDTFSQTILVNEGEQFTLNVKNDNRKAQTFSCENGIIAKIS